MQCRRCFSYRLLQLDKKRPQDHYVFRCQECGFIFSPGSATAGLAHESDAAQRGSARPGSPDRAQR